MLVSALERAGYVAHRGLCEACSPCCESPVADSGGGDATNRQHSVGMSWASCEWGAGHNLLPTVGRRMAVGLEALGQSCFFLIEG